MPSDRPVKGLAEWADLFGDYRVERVHGGRVVIGRLADGTDPSSPDVRRLLDAWAGPRELRLGPRGWTVLLFRPAPYRPRWWLHATLFLLTLVSTVLAGSLLAGHEPLGFIAVPVFGSWWLFVPTSVDWSAFAVGLPFGVVLVAILTLHESGHYVAARLHDISVTPPYFIPFPPYFSIIGTLGAFIRLRSPVAGRAALLDVGVAGPLMSFVASLPAIGWGLRHSRVVETGAEVPARFLVRFLTEELWLGGSLIFSGLAAAISGAWGSGTVVVLHPVAFAGWIGLFVTALNLLPISQLDGGHILYALLGRGQAPVAWVFFLALLPLGYLWPGWWVWAVLVLMVSRRRLAHPPVFNPDAGLDRARAAAAYVAIAVFALCFVPVPFRL